MLPVRLPEAPAHSVLCVSLDNPGCLTTLPRSVWKKESPWGKESHMYPLQPPVLIYCELVILSSDLCKRRGARRREG